MANRKPPPGKKFVKGQIANPRGAGAHNKEIKAIRRLTYDQLGEIGSLLLEGNLKELKAVKADPKAPALKVWMAAVALDAITYKNMGTLSAMLDRIVGKPKEDNTLTVNSPDGVTPFTPEEARAQFEASQKKC